MPEEKYSASALNNPQDGSPTIEPTESEEGLEVPSRMSDSMAADHVFDSNPPPFNLDTDGEGSDYADSSKDGHKEAQEHSPRKRTLDDYTGSFTHMSESPTGPEQRACEESLEDDPINTGTDSDSPQRLPAEEKEASPASHFQKNSKERYSFLIIGNCIVTLQVPSGDLLTLLYFHVQTSFCDCQL